MAELVGIHVDLTLSDTAHADIQKAVDGIAEKLEAIKVDLEIDDKTLETIKEFNKGMQELATNAQKAEQAIEKISSKPISDKHNKDLERTNKQYEQMTESAKKMADGTTSSGQQQVKTLRELQEGFAYTTEEVKKYNEYGEATLKIHRAFDSQGVHSRTIRTDGDNQVLGYEDLKRTKERQSATERLVGTKENLRRKLMDLNRDGRVTISSFERMNRVIANSGNVTELNRIRQALNRVDDSTKLRKRTRELEKQVRLQKEQAYHRVGRLQSQVHGRISEEDDATLRRSLVGYDNLLNRIRMGEFANDTRRATLEMRGLNQTISQTTQRVIDADQGMARFSRQLQSAMLRIPIYAAGMAVMYAPIRALRDAISQVIEIDSQMTVLERVSDGMINSKDAMEDSIEIAQKLGNTIAEVNEGLINYARQGFRGDDLSAVTEVATVMSNVSELDVDEAASSLTAAMKGFNIEAEESIRIVDAMNEVNISASCYGDVA